MEMGERFVEIARGRGYGSELRECRTTGWVVCDDTMQGRGGSRPILFDREQARLA
jgi:hypothetical protein